MKVVGGLIYVEGQKLNEMQRDKWGRGGGVGIV